MLLSPNVKTDFQVKGGGGGELPFLKMKNKIKYFSWNLVASESKRVTENYPVALEGFHID